MVRPNAVVDDADGSVGGSASILSCSYWPGMTVTLAEVPACRC